MIVALIAAAAGAPSVAIPLSSPSVHPTGDAPAKLAAAYGKRPIAFEPNHRQAPPDVGFLARYARYAAALVRDEIALALAAPAQPTTRGAGILDAARASSIAHTVQLRFVGADPEMQPRPLAELRGRVHGPRGATRPCGAPVTRPVSGSSTRRSAPG